MASEPKRPDFIRHYTAIEEPTGKVISSLCSRPSAVGSASAASGSTSRQSRRAAAALSPHAHERDEEFVYVIEGHPDAWIDSELHGLGPGDGIASPAGAGIAHCFLNDTESAVRLLIIGERHPEDRVAYPLNPERHAAPNNWSDAPKRSLGKHDGRPKRRN
jgi:mannose-6-phosphate isomerase-like protein (cupin superfamily)